MTKIMHAPHPGPYYWNFRCLKCGAPVSEHANIMQRIWNRLTKKEARQ